MILSRRQRDSLLDEMSRMLANKQTVAYANHAKISERLSNGELSLYMDTNTKSFIMKYAERQMKLNAREQTMSELKALIFANKKGTIKGITDKPANDSTLALSAKYGYDQENEWKKKFKGYNPKTLLQSGREVTITGITDENKYMTQHLLTYEYWKDNEEKCKCKDQQEQQENYDQRYAMKQHTHQQYIELVTGDNRYAFKDHNHKEYLNKPEIEDLIDKKLEPPWYEKLFNGLESLVEVGQTGYIAALQAQIDACYGILTANGFVDTMQSAGSLIGMVSDIMGGLSDFADVAETVGEWIPELNGTIQQITSPIREMSNVIHSYSEMIDEVFQNVENPPDWMKKVAHHIKHTGTLDEFLKNSKLPDAIDTISSGATSSGNIVSEGISTIRDLGAYVERPIENPYFSSAAA